MRELVQPISIGLAARGSVEDTVTWAREARERGLNTVWFHDSYFERDAVTYATAVAAQVPDIRVGLGALNPFTRHPVLVAMTISALDEIAPNRITLGMGTGLPLRLAQMGIPYTPDLGVEEVSKSMDTMRALWAGQRIPSATPNLMPIQPMFPPVHHVPIYIAAYRKDFLELTGQKADGYLARPCESLPGFSLIMKRIRAASVAAGRPEDAVESSGYLLTLIDKSRRAALNRAKREPFVIYMMAVLSDVSLKRAGFDVALRDQIMAAWRAEDYHRAAELIPDELLDAFMLCGTPNEVAEKAWQYHEAGMNIPALQPIVQEDEQIKQILDAAEIYGMGFRDSVLVPSVKQAIATSEASAVAASAPVATSVEDDSQLPFFERVRRHASAWFEIARPFSFTASMTPVMVGGALSLWDGNFNLTMFLYALIASVLLHMGTNVLNEIYDVRKGLDTITTPNASLALLKGRISEREAFIMVGVSFLVMLILAVLMLMERGLPLLLLGIIGVIGGYGYTAPPFQYKYHALGLPLVFLLMGPLMVLGSYFAITGLWSWQAVLISVPVGLLVTAILHGNEWRDISDDARAGISTLSIRYGRNFAHKLYVGLIIGAYLALGLSVAFGALPPMTLLALLSMPWLVRLLRDSELGASGQTRAIAMIDMRTAQLHSIFGTFMVAGLLLATVLLYLV
jgi:1,4-dihydroxy-2-naphthoate octaprenyltransferase